MDIEDSDEEQGFQSLQASIYNKISSPPNQATVKPALSGARLPEQSTAEQPIMHTTDVQSEQIVAEHDTNVMLEQPTTEHTTTSSATELLQPSST